METPEISATTIHNLTALWKHMGADALGGPLFRSHRWPHRLWLEWGYTHPDALAEAPRYHPDMG